MIRHFLSYLEVGFHHCSGQAILHLIGWSIIKITDSCFHCFWFPSGKAGPLWQHEVQRPHIACYLFFAGAHRLLLSIFHQKCNFPHLGPIPNFVGFLPQINHSQRMLGSIILYDILSSCVFPCRWSCTETLPSDNVKTEDCSGPQLLKIFTLGQGKNNTSWSDAKHVNDFNIHVLAAAKWRETKDQSYNLNLSIPMLSKLFKTAQNRFSLTISSQICIQK